MPAPSTRIERIDDDCPFTVTPDLGQRVADRARRDLGEDDREQRDPEEDRAAVDEDQQHDDEQERGAEQRAVDVLEDLDRVGREAGAAGDLDLEPAAGVADAVADVVDRVEDRLALAVAGDAADQQRRVARLRRHAAPRTASPRGRCRPCSPRSPALSSVRFSCDPLLSAGGEPALAPVDDHDRRLLAALQLLGDGQRLRRLRVARQERRRLVVLGVGVLAGQVRARTSRTGSRARPRARPTSRSGPRRR